MGAGISPKIIEAFFGIVAASEYRTSKFRLKSKASTFRLNQSILSEPPTADDSGL